MIQLSNQLFYIIALLAMDNKTVLNDIYNNPIRFLVESNLMKKFESLKGTIKDAIFYTLCLDEQFKSIRPTLDYNKRMRPYLIRLSSSAAWLEQDSIFWDLATVAELIHQSTLPADDIQDKSEIRCWRQALWKKFWYETAINAILLLAASGSLHYAKTLANDKNWKLHNYYDFFQENLNNLVNWQDLDLSANDGKRSISDYFKIVDWKTWTLINLALHFWTMPYKYLYSKEKSEALTKFSMWFARLYQIMDDIKDVKDGKNLDSSNVFHYVNWMYKELNNLYKKLRDDLIQSHNIMKNLWIIKDDRILNVIRVLIPKSFV